MAGGTLYRHFPTRLDLIEAVLADAAVPDAAAHAERLLALFLRGLRADRNPVCFL